MRKNILVILFTILFCGIFMTATASAHGIPGAAGTLEGIPSWLYASAGAIVVVASFVILGAFVRKEDSQSTTHQGKYIQINPSFVGNISRIFFVLLYLGVIITGLFGPNTTLTNPYPTIGTEILWWVSYGFFALVIGDFWPVINPWKTLFEWIGEPSMQREYPKWLGTSIALILFLAFVYTNFVISFTPWLVGACAALYGILMVLGMTVYGKEDWLWHADPFTRVFDFFGKVGILNFRERGIELRKWGVGLIGQPVQYKSEIAFVIALVYSLSFDGYKDTPYYTDINVEIAPTGVPLDLWTAIMGGIQLLVGFVVFLLAYFLFAAIMARMARTDRDVIEIAKRFVVTLIPIAGAYHIAHYSLYYFLAHEIILQTILSPLPGNEIHPEPGLPEFLSPELVWFYMAAFIVIGHVMAVWAAHHDSLECFREVETAIRSQIPMLVLMVMYTMVSLWIISQPFGG